MKLHNCLLSLAIAFSSVLATSSGSASSEAQKVLSKWDTESLKKYYLPLFFRLQYTLTII